MKTDYTRRDQSMVQLEIERLQYLLTSVPPMLRELDEEIFESKPAPDIWSLKEIIGHLIDEATNMHQTLARSQLVQDSPTYYDLHYWNRFGFYNTMSQQQIIILWETYNRQLLQTIQLIPDEYLERECNTGTGMLSMKFLIQSYLEDLDLHLELVANY